MPRYLLIFSAFLWLISSIIFFIFIFIPTLILRFFIITLSRLTLTNPGIPLPPRSGAYAVDDPYGPSPQGILVSLQTVQGLYSEATLRRLFDTRIFNKKKPSSSSSLAYPELRHKLVNRFGFYFLVPVQNSSLLHHIRYTHNQKFLTTRDLENLYESVLTTRFEPDTSPWELLVYPVPAQNLTYMIFRMHHSLGDGFSITQLLVADLCGHTEDSLAVRTTGNPNKGYGLISTIAAGIETTLRVPYDAAKQAMDACDDNILQVQEGQISSSSRPFHVLMSDLVHVSDVKRLKSQFPNSSFSSVILAAFTTGLGQFCLDNFGTEALPPFVHVSIPLRITRRDVGKMQNYHSFGIIRLPVGVKDSIEQLQLINEWIEDLKTSTVPSTNAGVFKVVGYLNKTLIKGLCTNRWTTALTSVFPGPEEQCFLGGEYAVEEMSFVAGLLGGRQGIGFFVLSYNGKFRIIATVDKRLIKEKEAARVLVSKPSEMLRRTRWY